MNTFYKKYIPYLFLLPAFVLLAVFFFIPFIDTILLSFKDFSTDIYNPQFIGFSNYIQLFKSKEFYTTLTNTFLFLIMVVPILALLPLIVAIFINQKIKWVNIYKILIYLPVIISIVVVAIAFKWLYAQQGILNYLAELFGLSAIGWLTDTKFALLSVAIVTIYKGIGYYMMIYLSALIGVPKDLYEAADIDGASAIKKHLTVTIPQIMPTIALVVIISSISALKVFTEIYVMTKGGPLNSTKTIVYYIYERAFENLDLSMASAASVVLLLVILAFSIINITCFENKRYKI
ncbi:TPA: sugar ABC transporter permease [Candidatus Avigastranaerophilus faecigallinarum]|nr:sugar ABC transporter permease [Candidatus Avigastranaerophilus faecigallinarum]